MNLNWSPNAATYSVYIISTYTCIALNVWRGTIQEKGVVGDGGVDRLGLAEGIGRRPVGTPSTTMGIVTYILKRGALKELCD